MTRRPQSVLGRIESENNGDGRNGKLRRPVDCGLATGSTYALIVVGMALLLLVRGVVHFGFAYIVVMTAYLGWVVLGLTGDNLFISIPAFIVIGTVLTVATEPLFRPLAQKTCLPRNNGSRAGHRDHSDGRMFPFL